MSEMSEMSEKRGRWRNEGNKCERSGAVQYSELMTLVGMVNAEKAELETVISARLETREMDTVCPATLIKHIGRCLLVE